jgi:fatty acid desaturase
MDKIKEAICLEQAKYKRDKPLGIQLRAELKRAGCFAPAPLAQICHMIIIILLFAGAYFLLLLQPGSGIEILALMLLAFLSVQAGYIAHEAGHGAITKKRWLIVLIGQFFNTFLTALCFSHFQKIHVCHHSHCNERDHDIDMQSGIFSLYAEAAPVNSVGIGKFVTRFQAFLIWPLVTLQGFTLKIDSLKTLAQNSRVTRIDQFVLLLHLLLWFGLPVMALGWAGATVNYLLLTWFLGPYLGTVFLVNHVGTHVVHPGDKLTPLEQRLLTTRDLGSSRINDVFFGGMNNHIEHHLFPSIPSARLRQARPIVRQFCFRHGLNYHETRWRYAIGEVFTYLNRIARQA